MLNFKRDVLNFAKTMDFKGRIGSVHRAVQPPVLRYFKYLRKISVDRPENWHLLAVHLQPAKETVMAQRHFPAPPLYLWKEIRGLSYSSKLLLS